MRTYHLDCHAGSTRPFSVIRRMVPMEGLEPSWYCYQRILSPPRLPIPPHRRVVHHIERSEDMVKVGVVAVELTVTV